MNYNHPIIKKIAPHFIAIVIFILAGIAYFTPVVDGYRINQSDIVQHRGTAKEIWDHRDVHGEEPLWTNSLFGGMPSTQISTNYPSNLIQHINSAFQLWLPAPLSYFFMLMLGFYILTQFLKIKPSIGIIGSLAYALSCYFVIIIMVGHNTKIIALSYLPAMIGAVIYTYRNNKIILGAALTSLFVALEFTANHVQITYYGMFVILSFVIVEFFQFYKRKELKSFFTKSAVLTGAFILGLCCAIGNIWGTMEYGKYTTRGGSEVTILPDGKEDEGDKTEGLDRSYITGWSYGIGETWNLLIPNAKGGASAAFMMNEEAMKEGGFTQEEKIFMQIAYQRDGFIFSDYWGDQSTTAGPTYIGAVIIFLFILAFIFIDDPIKWALLAATLLTMMLAWGKNLPGLTNFFIDYFPMYSKFRTVSMMLVIAELTMPLLAILVLKKITDAKKEGVTEIFPKEKIKQFMIATGSLLGIILVLILMKGGSIVKSPETEAGYFADYNQKSQQFIQQVEQEASQKGSIEKIDGNTRAIYEYSKQFLQTGMADNFEGKLMDYRKSVFSADAWRSFFIILVASALLFAFFKNKINTTVLIGSIGLLIIVDLWSVDKRWVNNAIAKDREGKEMKDDKGNPVYNMWTLSEVNLMPHVANSADIKILQNEVNENPQLGGLINESVKQFQEKKKNSGEATFQLTPQEIGFAQFGALTLNTNYRVLNTTARLDQDGRTSYFHKSLGGYHGAKLVRIQDVIDFHLNKEQGLARMALNQGTIPGIDSALKKLPIINMMNTKYIILSEGDEEDEEGEILDIRHPKPLTAAPIALLNPHACGNAWFVSSIKWVKNADEEIVAIGKFNPSTTAIIDEREKEKIGDLQLSEDPNALAKMESYKANHITYNTSSSKKGLLVFSEVYYPAGWKCLVDGNEVEIIRVNYLLRAIVLDAGKHKVEMVYEPSSYFTSKPISLVASISVIGFVLFAFYAEWKNKKEA